MHQAKQSEPKLSKGHVAFVAEYEFYETEAGLFRAPVANPISKDGRRKGEWYTSLTASGFAVRIAQMSGYPGPAQLRSDLRDKRWGGW